MKIHKAASSKSNAGHVLYGNNPDTGKWFERWYPTEEKAAGFADRKGWDIEPQTEFDKVWNNS